MTMGTEELREIQIMLKEQNKLLAEQNNLSKERNRIMEQMLGQLKVR